MTLLRHQPTARPALLVWNGGSSPCPEGCLWPNPRGGDSAARALTLPVRQPVPSSGRRCSRTRSTGRRRRLPAASCLPSGNRRGRGSDRPVPVLLECQGFSRESADDRVGLVIELQDPARDSAIAAGCSRQTRWLNSATVVPPGRSSSGRKFRYSSGHSRSTVNIWAVTLAACWRWAVPWPERLRCSSRRKPYCRRWCCAGTSA